MQEQSRCYDQTLSGAMPQAIVDGNRIHWERERRDFSGDDPVYLRILHRPEGAELGADTLLRFFVFPLLVLGMRDTALPILREALVRANRRLATLREGADTHLASGPEAVRLRAVADDLESMAYVHLFLHGVPDATMCLDAARAIEKAAISKDRGGQGRRLPTSQLAHQLMLLLIGRHVDEAILAYERWCGPADLPALSRRSRADQSAALYLCALASRGDADIDKTAERAASRWVYVARLWDDATYDSGAHPVLPPLERVAWLYIYACQFLGVSDMGKVLVALRGY